MSTALRADELTVGMLVTVLQGALTDKPSEVRFSDGELFQQTKTVQDDGGKGRILRITALDLPFCVVEFAEPFWHTHMYPVIFDLRCTVFKRVTAEYCRALGVTP